MAKKNSSKTATEKAIQSSEPRVITYKGWQGVNYADAPLTWEPLESGPGKFRQTDLPNNYLMVQNNLATTTTLGIETRPDSMVVGEITDSYVESLPTDSVVEHRELKFTGVAAVYHHWIFAAVHTNFKITELEDDEATPKYVVPADGEYIVYRSLKDSSGEDSWTSLHYSDPDELNRWPSDPFSIKEIGFYEGQMVVAIAYEDKGRIALAKVEVSEDGSSISIKGMDRYTREETEENVVSSTRYMEDPDTTSENLEARDWPYLQPHGMAFSYAEPDDDSDAVVRLDVKFCYTNRMGSTLASDIATVYVEYSPALWNSARYMTIESRGKQAIWGQIYDEGWVPPDREDSSIDYYRDPNIRGDTSIAGIDFYAREMENTDYVFIGHIDLDYSPGWRATSWKYNWFGNMTDTTQWLTSQSMVPKENTSSGPNVTHFTSHDSRLYYWGQPDKPYRLYIGGNPGAEFSIARGLGGAWVDIEPGSGFEIAGTAKWKTVQGANIVTIMCGNPNTNKVKRFNLVETNTTWTNEIATKSYMYEEVSNVVGCNSRWGYGVFADGLYSLSRYGLMLTTMAMEYNSQMKNQNVSELIKPIFSERLGNRLRDGRMVCIDDVIYIALSEDTSEQEPINLDNVILCYDMDLKSWYTFTHDQVYSGTRGEDPDKIHHIFAIDSDEFTEGLGAVTDTQVRLYPTTGIQEPSVPEFKVLLETGELMARQPMQAFWYIQQLEFRFDYLVSNPNDPASILIEGVDYYGRQFTIEKYINIRSRNHHGLTGEQRDYVEWIRVDKIVESMRIRIKGKARFRLTHINCKAYQQADTIGTPYGFDARDTYKNRKGEDHVIHHYIDDYNNLRRAVIS